MTARRAFGRRAPGLHATAQAARSNGLNAGNGDSLTKAYLETEDYARSLVQQDRDRRGTTSRTLLGALAVVLAVTFAVPFVTDIGSTSGPAPMTVAELDSLTPEQLAQLSPAAGGQQQDKGLFDRLFDALSN